MTRSQSVIVTTRSETANSSPSTNNLRKCIRNVIELYLYEIRTAPLSYVKGTNFGSTNKFRIAIVSSRKRYLNLINNETL